MAARANAGVARARSGMVDPTEIYPGNVTPLVRDARYTAK